LWTCDGTIAGTYEVKDIDSTLESNPYRLTSFNGKFYFQANSREFGREVWMSGGTQAGTQLLKDIYPGSGFSNNPDGFKVFNNSLYFTSNDSIHGTEIWKSDGTSSGTQLLKDIYPGTDNSMPGGYLR